MIKKQYKNQIKLQEKMINSYLDDEFYSFFTEEAIISLKKVRKIGLKNFSLSGNISSLKLNNVVSFESSLERDYINILEFNSSVVHYCEQPIKIFYTLEDKEHYYVPDFFVRFNDNREDELVEIKYKDDLLKNKKKYFAKFKAAKMFCEANGLKFKIVNEDGIRTPFLLNCKFLLPYRRPKNDIDYSDIAVLEERIKSVKHATPKSIITDSFFPDDRKAELLYALWYMIANSMVNIDLNMQITMNSKITI